MLATHTLVEISVILVEFTFAYCQYVDNFVEDFIINYKDLDNSSSEDDGQITEKIHVLFNFTLLLSSIYEILFLNTTLLSNSDDVLPFPRSTTNFTEIYSYITETALVVCLTSYCIMLLMMNIVS